MGFALDHADASADVVGVLKESLLVPETPIHGAGNALSCMPLCLFARLVCVFSVCFWLNV